MRRVAAWLMRALVLCLVMPAGSHAFSVRDGVAEPALAGNSLFYVTDEEPRALKRLELTTQVVSVAYRPPRGFEIDEVRGNGRALALQLDSDGRRHLIEDRSRILAFDPQAGTTTTLVDVRYRNRGRLCGQRASLAAVSPEGEILYEMSGNPCRRNAKPFRTVTLHDRRAARVLERNNEDGGALYQVVSGRVLKWTAEEAVVTDVSTRAQRRVLPVAKHGTFAGATLDPFGTVAVAETSSSWRSTRLRLHSIGDRARGGRTLYTSRRRESSPWFCGEKLLEYRSSRRGERLLLWNQPPSPPRTLLRSEAFQPRDLACDDRTAVLLSYERRGRTQITVFTLDHQ